MLKVLSLFAGIGGFDLGLERTGGFKTVAFCEIDPFCRRVLAKHWPGVPIIDDVRTAEFPDADVIVGGFPCQDVSRAGKRAGLAGARSGLYRELVRAIRMVRPRHAIVENVAALVGDGLDAVLGDLAESGYDAEWDCVPAGSLGAPHERDRVWIVAHAADAECVQGGERHDVAGVGRRQNEAKQIGVGSGDQGASKTSVDAQSFGCGAGQPQRPPDSFAWIRGATRWHASNANGSRYAVGEGERRDAREELAPAERAAFCDVWESRWPCEPALLGMDDGVPSRVDRTRCLGNTLVPQIPELIGRAILSSEGF